MTRTLIYGQLLFFTIAAVSDAARILALFPLAAKSHHYVFQPIIRALAERGHDITFYTPIRLEKNYTNVKEIEIHLPDENIFNSLNFETLRKLGEIPIVSFIKFWPWTLSVTENTLSHPEMQTLIHSDDKYDLILLETHFGQEAFTALGHKFKAPVISLASFISFPFIDEFFGNPFANSYVPGFELPYDNEMTFLQRCHNTVRTLSMVLVGYYFYLPQQNRCMRKYFNYTGSNTIPPLVDMVNDVALVIINSQIAIDYPRPFVPNIIGVAGLHIASKNKPLPKDLKDFLDGSKNGVVYVSFGSLVPAAKMPVEMRDALINAFKQLKENVLWRLPVDSLPGLPKNIKLSKWLPQQDVLAHPNVKAFMTHGGSLSQQEALYYNVPLISVPFFGDQPMNVKRAAKHGFSVYLDSFNLTETSVTWALNEVLNNPKYQEGMSLRSKIFRDNPEPPIEKALYWIEYVIRFQGAPHLRTDARKMSYFKYLSIDVFGFLVLLACVILYGILLALKFLVYFLHKNSKVQLEKKQK